MTLRKFTDTVHAPPADAFAVTPADDTQLAKPTRALWIGTAGNLAVRFADSPGSAVTFTNVPVGLFLGMFYSVEDTGTTASGIVALV